MALVVIKVTKPAVLAGQSNGLLDPSILVSITGLGGGPTVRFVQPAGRAWQALSGSAPMVLKATSSADSFRTYAQQLSTWHARYEPDPFPGYIDTRVWPEHYDLQGRLVARHTWYQKPRTAVAAWPGSSNHGWGLAIDVANASGARLDWLEANAVRFGWSWETVPSEPWHLRYFAGDNIPPAVLAYEQGNNMSEWHVDRPDLPADWNPSQITQGPPDIAGQQRDTVLAWALHHADQASTGVRELLARPPAQVELSPEDMAAIVSGVVAQLTPVIAAEVAKAGAEARDAVGDLAEGGSAAVRADA